MFILRRNIYTDRGEGECWWEWECAGKCEGEGEAESTGRECEAESGAHGGTWGENESEGA